MAPLYLAILALFAWLMITRRLSATAALPLAAFSLAAVALLPLALESGPGAAATLFVTEVIEGGFTRLISTILAVLLGSVLASQLKVSGAAERMVRYCAEYAGEDRFRLGALMLLVMAMLFTVLSGLGAVILVASIALPVLFSVGFERRQAAAIMLLALSLGGCLNPANWVFYIDALKLQQAQIVPFAGGMFVIFLLVSFAYLLHATGGLAALARQFWPLFSLALFGTLIALVALLLPEIWQALKVGLAWLLLLLLGGLLLALLIRAAYAAGLAREVGTTARSEFSRTDNWFAAAAVLVPLLVLLWTNLARSLAGSVPHFEIPVLTALLAGILCAALAGYTGDGGALNRLMRSLHDGAAQCGPALFLLLGIGMLLKATALPGVQGSLTPLIAGLPLRDPLAFIAIFFILSPLALYRGPLNLYGMGSGIVGIMAGSGAVAGGQALPAILVMVAFFSVGMLQGVCDPTNTHNVWIANYCKVTLSDLTRHTLPWALAIVLLGLVAGSLMYARQF